MITVAKTQQQKNRGRIGDGLLKHRNVASAWFSYTSLILLGLILVGLAPGCSSTDDGIQEPLTPAERKAQLLRLMENGVAQIKAWVGPKLEDVRVQLEDDLARLDVPIRLQVIDPVLSKYGSADEEVFRSDIESIVEDCVKESEALLKKAETGIRNYAYEIAETDVRSDSEFSTGFDDLDAMVEDAIDSVRSLAAIPRLEDLGYLRRGETLRLGQNIRVDRKGYGRMALYLSPPLKNAIIVDQESQAAVLTFTREGNELDEDVPVEFVQAVRKRLIRAGVPVFDTGWQLDPDGPAGDGVLPLDVEASEPGYLVSDLAFPLVNNQSLHFDSIADHTVRYEYEAAVRRKDTGDYLVGIRWELRWLATRKGPLIAVDNDASRPRTESFEILDLLSGSEPAIPAALEISREGE